MDYNWFLYFGALIYFFFLVFDDFDLAVCI